MKVVKKTSEYTVLERRDGRYAVQGSNKRPVNGDEKIKILVAEGLVKVAVAAAPEPEVVEEAAVEEAAAEETPVEEAAAEAAPVEEEKPE
ncbi:hypothetical protein N9063_01300 [Deltaproteobacteria bacterium]|nr:hypothetical protein [Deltaproteobacteria bacterium]